jgi:hypothetical protein
MGSKQERQRGRDHQKTERLRFIDEELFWSGEVTRRSVMENFGVSEETAKTDLRDYRQHYAPDLPRDPRDNIYRVGLDFMPRVFKPDAEAYLDRLARGGTSPPIDRVPDVVRRTIHHVILQNVLRAIREKHEIEILYCSSRAETAKKYRIYPHALLHDGFRWSVRSYVRREAGGGHWGEMVLDRIEEVFDQHWPVDTSLEGSDDEWRSVVELEIIPNPGLDPALRSLIEQQYEMEHGRKIVPVRRCMLPYFLKRYQLDEPITLKAPHQAPLALRNRSMTVELLSIGMRVPLKETEATAPNLMQLLCERLPGLTEQEILERALQTLLQKSVR